VNRQPVSGVEGHVRLLATLVFLLAGAAVADEPLRLSLNLTTGGRWLEGTKVLSGKSSLLLEGSDLTMGGTLDVMKRLGVLRVGGQLGADVMLFPEDLQVVGSGPLGTTDVSEASVSAVLFLSASPFVGAMAGETGELQGWVDLLVTLELTSARVDRERHFALTPVPTLRLGTAFPLGPGAGFELSFLASYFGAPRLAFAMGAHF
jgi:hypothetical protein